MNSAIPHESAKTEWRRAAAVAMAVLVAIPVLFGTADAAASHHYLANGLDVTLYPADVLREQLTRRGDTDVLLLDDGRTLDVITDIDDPAISNHGDGEFHPFDADATLDALSQVSQPNLHMSVTVYLLPYPRRSILVSSTSGAEIFLSPHVLDIRPEVASYIVTHELGHAFHNRYLPDNSRGWADYRRVRGIQDESVYFDAASHAYRPKEIFAEDFRVFFGGGLAVWDGQVENPTLVPPELVAGLDSFMSAIGGERVYAREVIAASSYPNPFNPDTRISLTVPDDVLAEQGAVSVRIYDVRGALVKELYSGVPAGASLNLRWDGTDRSGNHVASSQYFAQIRAGVHRTTLKLVMLK